jgi:hypothetical protein
VDTLVIRSRYSNERIERELGYRHGISIEAGLHHLVVGASAS